MSKLEEFIEEKQVFIDRAPYKSVGAVHSKDLRELGKTHVLVPREPSDGLMMSCALRLNHAIGMPDELYDRNTFTGEIDEGRRKRTLEGYFADIRRIHEELTGSGFYSPEKEDEYKAMIQAESGIIVDSPGASSTAFDDQFTSLPDK